MPCDIIVFFDCLRLQILVRQLGVVGQQWLVRRPLNELIREEPEALNQNPMPYDKSRV